MSAILKRYLTAEQYLAKERAAEYRSEYFAGEMFAMAGTSFAHTRIKASVERCIGNQLDGSECQVVSSGLRVKVSATGLYTYPDLLVVRGEPQLEDRHLDTLLNPRCIIEIISESTESYDRGTKFACYRTIESLQEYVLIAQDRPRVERYSRQADGSWLLVEFSGLDRIFELTSIDAKLPLAQIYNGIALPENPGK